MTQLFNEETGAMVPVTIVTAGPCFISQIKTVEKDGYSAIQVAFKNKKHVSKPQEGHFKKIGANAVSKEFRVTPEEAETFAVGDKIDAGSFEKGDVIRATGTSKGHGFAGVVKRHGFSGSLASHGHKDQLRMPGSIGATDPGRVFKGMRMGGHMGDEQVTTTGLKIEKVDADMNQLYIRGAVPGAINGYLSIKGDGSMTVVKDDKSTDTSEEKTADTEVASSEKVETATDTTPVAEKAKSEENAVAEKQVSDAPVAEESKKTEEKVNA